MVVDIRSTAAHDDPGRGPRLRSGKRVEMIQLVFCGCGRCLRAEKEQCRIRMDIYGQGRTVAYERESRDATGLRVLCVRRYGAIVASKCVQGRCRRGRNRVREGTSLLIICAAQEGLATSERDLQAWVITHLVP